MAAEEVEMIQKPSVGDDNESLDSISSDPPKVNDNQDSTKPRVPIWRIVLLSGVGFAVEMGYGIQVAYALPLLVASGVKLSHASLILALSPFIGVIIHSPLGIMSDKCSCRWGRRRPFILGLMLTMIIGCAIAPHSALISSLGFTGSETIGITFTGIGVLMFDLSLGQIQLPLRAYVLDVLPSEQVQQGNFIVTLFGGLGGFFGCSFAAVNWSVLLGLEESIVTEAQVFFSLAVLIMIVSLICTLCSVKERQNIGHITHSLTGTDQSLTGTVQLPADSIKCCKSVRLCRTVHKTFVESLQFIFNLSKEMWILWFVVLLGFVADFAIVIYVTTFVGEVVYGGDSNAPVDSVPYLLYTKGVRVGSWGLAISMILLAVCMIVSSTIVKYLGLKTMCLVAQYAFVIALLVLPYVVGSVPAVIILISLEGPFLGILLTFPYVLISYYKVCTE